MTKKKTKTYKTLSILEKNEKQAQFDYSEVYRQIRTNIEFSNLDKKIQTMVITSTKHAEAKTTLSMNLAYIYAAKYKKVLIIDCDLRKETLHRYMKLSNTRGLTNSLLEYSNTKKINMSDFQVVSHDSFYGDLSVLTTGSKVHNPSEILGSKVFKEYLEELKKIFEFIIIDCPPIGMVSDAIEIGSIADGTIFVVSAEDTNKKDASDCIKRLQRANVKVIGSVLTKSQRNFGNSYYYYYY